MRDGDGEKLKFEKLKAEMRDEGRGRGKAET
jgi:hypothetical protein